MATHVYYGFGKGKTCSAVGQVIRMIGHGRKAAFCQFIKDGSSGEIDVLTKLGVKCCWPVDYKSNPSTTIFFKYSVCNLTNYSHYDIIVLDEVLDAIVGGAIEEIDLVNFIGKCNEEKIELIITGHYLPEPGILQRVDYLTHFEKKKHPYDKGILAREGIEY